jgi:universal stress protein E
MGTPNQIMVVMDGSLQRTSAVLRAQALARKTNAVLQLRCFEYVRKLARVAGHGFDLDAYLQGRRERLEEFAQHIREEGVRVECAVIWGRPMAEQILLQALALKPNLVIKDVSPESALNRAFMSRLDWQLLAECPAPLMLVHPGAPNLPKRIVAAVDPLDEHGKPHELNDDILTTAISLSMQCQASLDVANACEFVPLGVEAEAVGWVPDLTLYEELRKVHAEALYALARKYSLPPSSMHILSGDPALAIAGFAADKRADLVVMGSVYRTGLKRLVLGATAEGAFDRLVCDLLVLKPAGYAAELAARLETPKPKAA